MIGALVLLALYAPLVARQSRCGARKTSRRCRHPVAPPRCALLDETQERYDKGTAVA